MKRSLIILGLVFFSILPYSCEKAPLDPNIDNALTDEDTWGFPEYAEGVLMNAYAAIPGRFNHYSNNFLDVATDNAVTNGFGAGIYNLAAGGSISEHSNPIGNWTQAYKQIRNINLFLANGLGENVIYNLTDEETDSLYRRRLKGEAYFLRAWWGFKLLQDYGGKTNTGKALGYPIVTDTLTGEELTNTQDFARASYEENVTQIMADIDTAVAYLPRRYRGNNNVTGITGLGRADDQIAHSLKSIVLLYAASPAYQDDDITRLSGMGEFTVVDPAAYQEKWIQAAEAAHEAMQVVAGKVSGLDARYFSRPRTPNEFIWRKYHNDNYLESYNFPPLDYGLGLTSPSQNLVESFPAQNGFPITDPRSNFDPEDPYGNRDPRLSLNVLYNGREFLGDPLQTFVGGRDSKGVHPNATRTGYYLRKWLVLEDLLNPENPSNDHHYHVLIRKTELLLNFAEASNEAWGPTTIGPGMNQSALDALKTIRSNAGITNHTYITEVANQGKDAFRELIQNERRIELAFENHRYFDMRRWLLPLNEPVMGIRIIKKSDGTFDYEEYVVEKRQFNDVKYYYQPIPYSEIVRSEGLINNLGW